MTKIVIKGTTQAKHEEAEAPKNLGIFQLLKSQFNIFGGEDPERGKKRSATHMQPKLTLGSPAKSHSIGETKDVEGKKYIFLETTVGKPRWHSHEELKQMKAEGKTIPAVAKDKMPDLGEDKKPEEKPKEPAEAKKDNKPDPLADKINAAVKKENNKEQAEDKKPIWEMTLDEYAHSVGSPKPEISIAGDVSFHQLAWMSERAKNERAKQLASKKAEQRDKFNTAKKEWSERVWQSYLDGKFSAKDVFDMESFYELADKFESIGMQVKSPFKIHLMAQEDREKYLNAVDVVAHSINEGKSIPADVFPEYPDLAPKQSKEKDKEQKQPKQPWEMTKKEYADSKNELPEAYHRNAVISAFTEGKPVPENVLAEYPELGPKSKEESGPQIGDTKTENGVTYTFLETTPGKPRWHSPEEVAEANKGQEAEASTTDSGTTEVEEELQGTEIPEPEDELNIPDEGEAPETNGQPRREYVDTGEKIGGARKDTWVQKIKDGKTLVQGDINMDELEKDKAEAYKVITKENYQEKFKEQVESFTAAGFESGALFLSWKLATYIAERPADTPEARQNYVAAMDLLHRNVYTGKTAKEVIENIQHLSEMCRGYYISDEDKATIDEINNQRNPLREKVKMLRDEADKTYQEITGLQHEKYKAERRKKRPTPELDKKINQLNETWQAQLAVLRPIEEEVHILHEKRFRIERKWDQAADTDPHSTRNVIKSLGEKFVNAIDRRSQAFVDSMNEALNMKPDNWEWANQNRKASTRKATVDILKQKRWSREIPDIVERNGMGVGPKTFKPGDLMDSFGIRGVEYGNWMDEASSKYHTELAGMAMQDLADTLGVDKSIISYNGRLAMAFGARGTGNFKLTAAAHYEPARTVINLTKFRGGGTLAHEWGHFFDNVIARLSFGDSKGKTSFLSEGDAGEEIPQHIVKAMNNLMDTMKAGDHKMYSVVEGNPKFKHSTWRRVDQLLQAGMSGQDAFDKLSQEDTTFFNSMMANYAKFGYGPDNHHSVARTKKYKRQIKDLAGYIALKTETNIRVPDEKNPSVSKFYASSLCNGTYWSSSAEMFARCFESYISDKIDEKGAANSYLVTGVRDRQIQNSGWMKFDKSGILEATHKDDPEAMAISPYPFGEERKRINAAMEEFINAVKSTDVLEKSIAAAMNKATTGKKRNIAMDLKELVEEHKHLVKLLRTGTPEELKAEAEKQEKELEHYMHEASETPEEEAAEDDEANEEGEK